MIAMHLARLLQGLAKVLDRVAADELLSRAATIHEGVDLRSGTVEYSACEVSALDVQYEVLAHDGEADKPEISSCSRHRSGDLGNPAGPNMTGRDVRGWI